MVLPYPDCENSTNCDGQERNRDSLVYPSYRHTDNLGRSKENREEQTERLL